MSDSDPRQERAKSTESRATQSRVAALAAEVALRDRELVVLREALSAERVQARAARSLAEENLKEAEHAAHVQRQLEQVVSEISSSYSALRLQDESKVAVVEGS
jgi:hypothetical protein